MRYDPPRDEGAGLGSHNTCDMVQTEGAVGGAHVERQRYRVVEFALEQVRGRRLVKLKSGGKVGSAHTQIRRGGLIAAE